MKTILGLDLGSSSIGWAVVKQSDNREVPAEILGMGVRVNPLTVDEKGNFEKGKSITTTAERTLKRGMRRNLQRYKQRRDALVEEMRRAGMITSSTILSEEGSNTTHETLRLRATAAREQVSLEQLARVFLNINKKRGYKSNRKAKNDDEGGQLIDGMEVARKLYDEQLTPGQLAFELLSKGKKYIPSFYPSDLKNELKQVLKTQQAFYGELTPEFIEKLEGKNRRATLAIFKDVLKIDNEEEKDRKKRRVVHYHWRSDAASKKIELPQLATVVAEINGDINNASGYLGAISDHSKELFFKKMTVGELMWDKLRANPHHSFKNVIFYRMDYLQEFNTIWDTQSQFYPEVLTDDLKQRLRDVIIFYQRRLRSQKGLIAHCELESEEITITTPEGKQKTVIKGPRVCPKSSPLFQEFKVWQTINNVTVNDSPLNERQRRQLHHQLTWSRELKDKDALKALGLSAKGNRINFKSLPGNTTQVAMLDGYRRVLEVEGYDVEDFEKRDLDERLDYVSRVFKELGAHTEFFSFDMGRDNEAMQHNPMYKLWHLLYSYEDDNSASGSESLIEHLQALTGLPREAAAALAGVTFEQDYGSLSAKAIHRILPFMIDEGLGYADACAAAGYRHSKNSLTRDELDSRELTDHLDLLRKGSLRNPVVEKILNQMIHVVNGAIKEYGTFDEIHVEMARELKQTQKQREDTSKRINEKSRKNEEIRQLLKTKFNIPYPTRNDVLRYQLYQELAPNGYKTLYSNTYIPEEELFSRRFDIEHIIPQAKLFDDSQSNKTLEARAVNIEKSDATARDYVMSKYGEQGLEEYKKRIAFLNAPGTKQKYKLLLVKEENGHLLYDDGKELVDFVNRDLTDSQYIARKATEILRQVTRDVVPTLGSITARLREDWQLIDVMKELNFDKYNEAGLVEWYENHEGKKIKRITNDWTKRNDHRHHALDALTVAFTRRQHIQYLNNLSSRNQDDPMAKSVYGIMRNELVDGRRFIAPMPVDRLRAEVKKFMRQILVSIKAKNKVVTPNVNKVKNSDKRQVTLTPRGQLHNETVYGRRMRYVTKLEKVNASFDQEKIMCVASREIRLALLERLAQNGGDAKKAFTGKNSLEKNPIYLNASHTRTVPEKVKTVVMEEYYTIRKPITPDLKIDKVVDAGIRQLLKQRLEEYGNAKDAFSNLDENPIYLNREKGITIKSVTITGVANATALHEKKDHNGKPILNDDKQAIPTDYVSTSNNHHVAIFVDEDGNYQEHIVSFFEATSAINQGLPVVDKNYNAHLGWKFLFTLKQNEYFVFPDEKNGFYPEDIDLMNPENYAIVSEHLYRVQKFSSKYYVFRHHLETNVEDVKELQNKTWIRITALNKLKGIVKVRVNHLGRIVDVGEY